MRDQDPTDPGSPPSGDGWERPPAPVTRGRFGEPRPGTPGSPGPQDASRRNGHHVPADRGSAEPDEDGPVDLVELQADDELINALSSGLGVSGPGRQGYDADDRLVAMLASWKSEVDDRPVPELVDTDEAVQMLQPAKPPRKLTFLRPLVAAAAVAACALAVVSISAHEAEPGDALWGVTRVLYSEHAQQVQAQSDLRTGIERVNAKLAAGDTAGARQDLASLGPLVEQVGPDQQSYFVDQQRFLTAKVAEAPPGTPTDPRAPLRDGTPAPRPPASTEGEADRPEPVSPRPGPGSSSPGGTGDPTSPGSGSSSPEDPRVLQGPGGESDSPSPTAPSDPAESSPSTEGSPDPTTTTPSPTQPTAAGEGTADPPGPPDPSDPRRSSPSSTSSGAVSSTPN